MAFAQGSRTQIAYGVQSDFDTVASTFTVLPVKSFSLELSKEAISGGDLLGDRMPRISRHGNRSISGSLEVDMRKGAYDDLLESALFSSFDTSDEMTVGTTPKFLTFEQRFLDIGQYRLFSGVTVNSASFDISNGQMIGTTFDFVGKDMSISQTGKTVSAASSNQPFDSYSGAIYAGGTGTGDIETRVQSISFSITNNVAPIYAVGSDVAPQLEYGRSVIEGTMSVYFDNLDYMNKFLNETEDELQLVINEPSGLSPYTFYFPRIKLNSASVPLSGETSLLQEVSFQALYDSTAGTQLKVTRTS